MSKCLVTTLKGIVNDDSLRKFDVITIEIPTAGDYQFIINGCKGILTNGYFSDSNYSENLGTTAELAGNVYIVASADCKLELYNYSQIVDTFSIWRSGNASNATIKCNLDEVFTNQAQLSEIRLGQPTSATSNTGSVCIGDIADIKPNVLTLNMGGCQVSGTIDDVIRNYCTENNLTSLNIHATPITLHTEALAGKSYLTLLPSTSTRGNIKYYADIANTTLRWSNTSASYHTGSVEELIARAISIGSSKREMAFQQRANATRVTYNGNPLTSYYDNSKTYIKFTWDDLGQNVTISYE